MAAESVDPAATSGINRASIVIYIIINAKKYNICTIW